MSPRRKQGRPDSIVTWLYADPWRKLGAIALALVSWEYLDKRVNAEHTSTLEIRLPGQAATTDNYLRIDIDPQDYTLTQNDVLNANGDKPLPRQQIEVEMKGEKGTINRMKGTLKLRYSPTRSQLERAANETGSLTFGIENLLHEKADLGEDLKKLGSVEMTPRRIRLSIRRNTAKTLPLVAEIVRLDFGTSGLEDRLSSPEFSHPTVELRGPQKAVESLSPTGKIFQGKVNPVTSDASTVRVDLELLPSLKDIVTGTSIHVVYNVEPDWEPIVFKNVPIDIDNRLLGAEYKGQEPFRVDPVQVEVVKLNVKGDLADKLKNIRNPQELADFQQRHLRLVVYPQRDDLNRKEPWPMRLKIEFILFDDMPTPRKDKDFKVLELQQVRLIRKKSEGQ